MQHRQRSNLYTAVVAALAALLVLFVWMPLDIRTGIVEFTRGRYVVGDSMAPAVAVLFVLVGAAIVLIVERNVPGQPVIARRSLRFILMLAGVLGLGVLAMRYAGPLAVSLADALTDQPLAYRLLRDTVPWKYVGFMLGGVIQVSGMIAIVEGRLSLRGLFVGVVAVLVLIAVFDLPFENLLLPPNGDV